MGNGSASKPFIEEYEEFAENTFKQLMTSSSEEETLGCLLREKRAFGLKKYGDISFQSSYENAMKVDTLQHAREELIDYLNYMLHEIYKAHQRKDFVAVADRIYLFKSAVSLYTLTKE